MKVNQLKKNDLFYMDYGFQTLKFRVLFASSSGDLILAHSLKWCYKDSMKIDQDAKIYYAGKISKFRAFFLI